MFLVEIEKQNIYLAFSDLTKHLNESIKRELFNKNIDKKVVDKIIEFIKNNSIDDNFKRQKNYVSNLTTYIDIMEDKYNLSVFILPKDIELINSKLSKIETFKKIEKLSINIFKLYNRDIESKDIQFKGLKEFEGETFLELEAIFYKKELNRLYNYLLNYKRNLKDKIVCSDKKIGVEIEELNRLESNPLKNYQFVKIAHQEDLIIFIYSLIEFLKDKRLKIFENLSEYKEIKKIINKIYNFLRKISSSRHLKRDKITLDNLQNYFIKYKNLKEIQKNLIIYEIAKNIFNNQLKEGVFFLKKIDLTKMFEAIIYKKLSGYGDNLYVGDENKKSIFNKENKKLDIKNNLLEDKNNPIYQYPDYLIKENNIFHIIDAKYKLKDNIFKNRDIFWQILIYSRLFNKNIDLQKVKKIIIYAKKSKINIDKIENIDINSEKIDINKKEKFEIYNENVFDSKIYLLEVASFKTSNI